MAFVGWVERSNTHPIGVLCGNFEVEHEYNNY
jgi:hypothetical protein